MVLMRTAVIGVYFRTNVLRMLNAAVVYSFLHPVRLLEQETTQAFSWHFNHFRNYDRMRHQRRDAHAKGKRTIRDEYVIPKRLSREGNGVATERVKVNRTVL